MRKAERMGDIATLESVYRDAQGQIMVLYSMDTLPCIKMEYGAFLRLCRETGRDSLQKDAQIRALHLITQEEKNGQAL
jgi:hypothetical protein